MVGTLVADFRLSFTFFHKTDGSWLHDRVNHFMLSAHRNFRLRGSLISDHDAKTWLDVPNKNLSQEDVIVGLRFVRNYRARGLGCVAIGGPLPTRGNRKELYERGTLAIEYNNEKKIDLPLDCPLLVALRDYIEHGDEADLFAVIDMLTDAGKFDNV